MNSRNNSWIYQGQIHSSQNLNSYQIPWWYLHQHYHRYSLMKTVMDRGNLVLVHVSLESQYCHTCEMRLKKGQTLYTAPPPSVNIFPYRNVHRRCPFLSRISHVTGHGHHWSQLSQILLFICLNTVTGYSHGHIQWMKFTTIRWSSDQSQWPVRVTVTVTLP